MQNHLLYVWRCFPEGYITAEAQDTGAIQVFPPKILIQNVTFTRDISHASGCFAYTGTSAQFICIESTSDILEFASNLSFV